MATLQTQSPSLPPHTHPRSAPPMLSFVKFTASHPLGWLWQGHGGIGTHVWGWVGVWRGAASVEGMAAPQGVKHRLRIRSSGPTSEGKPRRTESGVSKGYLYVHVPGVLFLVA